MHYLVYVFCVLTCCALGLVESAQAVTQVEWVAEQLHKETKDFCSVKSAERAMNKCQKWLDLQKKSLGNRTLTFHCEDAIQATSPQAPCLYRSVGQISFVLKSVRTETRD